MKQEYRFRGVRLNWDALTRTWSYDSVDNEVDAESWGVYKVQDDGTDLWVADFDTKERAKEYIELKNFADFVCERLRDFCAYGTSSDTSKFIRLLDDLKSSFQ